ncbi:hypothetical protein O6H91_18G056600 [Diphasiastrum complanatum]|uniref:Uncharacterized protein n=1 Tax=Diphasiastrum complanatum TaxID=34168 RepID=A0ACC2B1J3_DIPCM|nr:hypothetical protein O6H91_18G056600 [Diphasiastrum complanatum]
MEGAGEKSPGFSVSVAKVQHNIRVAKLITNSIRPAKKTDPHWVTLTNLDRLHGHYYTPVILYYPYEEGRCLEKVAQKLKDSLAEALVAFYPLAGRVVQNENELAKLHCNDAGAVFTEAYVDGVLDDLKAQTLGYHPVPELNGMAAAGLPDEDLNFTLQSTGLAALVIQLTHFSCGGISLAFNWHHKVGDGSAGFHFLKCWCAIAGGKPISPFPVHDRSLVQPRDPPQVLLDITNTVKILHPSPSPKQSADDPQQIAVIHFEKEFVEKLKTEASKDGGTPFTAHECISAHLWKLVTNLRSHIGRQDVHLSTIVDGRRKLGLPPGFFSNVVAATCSTMAADDLLSRPLSYVASIVRGSIRQVGDENYRSTVDWVQLQGNANVGVFGPQMVMSKDLMIVSWALPMYELDFGWGRPGFAMRNSLNHPGVDGMIYTLPTPPQHGKLLALMHLPKSLISKLLANPSLLTSDF